MRRAASSEKPRSPSDFQITSTQPEPDDPAWDPDGGFDCEAGTRDCLFAVVKSVCLRAAEEEVGINFESSTPARSVTPTLCPLKFSSKPGVTN